MQYLLLDTETTGLDERAEIIEIGLQWGLDSENAKTERWRFKPKNGVGRSSRVHGITDADLADCPEFSACCDAVRDAIESADVVVAYNAAFDRLMLDREFDRAGVARAAWKLVIDPKAIWSENEGRSLSDFYARFVGGSFSGAHSALGDCRAMGAGLGAMVRLFDLDLDAIAQDSAKLRSGGKFRLSEDGSCVAFAFGKWNGRSIFDPECAGYLEWMLGASFSADVVSIARRALEGEEGFLDWWRETVVA